MPTGIVRNNRAMSQRERRPKLSVIPTEEDNVAERPGRETGREGPVQTDAWRLGATEHVPGAVASGGGIGGHTLQG